MSAVIKFIIGIVAILGSFLAGWFFGSREKQRAVREAVKKTIRELNEEHEKALKKIKKEYEEQLKEKEKIIRDLKDIIRRLIKELKRYSDGDKMIAKLIQTLEEKEALLVSL